MLPNISTYPYGSRLLDRHTDMYTDMLMTTAAVTPSLTVTRHDSCVAHSDVYSESCAATCTVAGTLTNMHRCMS